MQTGAGQSQYQIARADAPAIDNAVSFNHTDTEPGQVIFARLVKVGQDGCFSAHQSTLRFHAAVADPFDDFPRQDGIITLHGQVIEKEKRFATAA
jgi:hypothetical protein